MPHRFSAFLKAKQPTEITLQLAGERTPFQIRTNWTEIEMNITPPNHVVGGIPATITIPADADVLLDEVSFRPIRSANSGGK